MFRKGANIRDLFVQNEKQSQIRRRRLSQDDKMPQLISPKIQIPLQQPKLSFHIQQIPIYSQEKSPEKKTFYFKINSKRKLVPHSQSLHVSASATQTTSNINQYLGKINYSFKYMIGVGGFGRVWKVEHKRTKQIFALKELLKAKILGKNSVKSIMNERNLLEKLKHPFIVNIVSAFQDRDCLYLVMDYLQGGDLRYHFIQRRQFKEEEISIEYMHENNVIHRDLKPENIVLDNQGYIRITDLGIARYLKPDNHNETSGTPGYMAPEVLLRQNHSFGVDHFAIGVIAYEMITGRRPYQGRSRKEVRDEILCKQVQLNEQNGYSNQLIDFVNKLIQRKQSNRLGSGGIIELKEHYWFTGFDWEGLQTKKQKSCLQIMGECHRSISYQESGQTMIEEFNKQLRQKEVQQQFEGYTYIITS